MEDKKLKAALDVVSESVLNGWKPESYIKWLKLIMPEHYKIEWNGKGVHCKSSIGISDEEEWEYLMGAFKRRIDANFQEVYHNTSYNHKDFIIYIKQ